MRNAFFRRHTSTILKFDVQFHIWSFVFHHQEVIFTCITIASHDIESPNFAVQVNNEFRLKSISVYLSIQFCRRLSSSWGRASKLAITDAVTNHELILIADPNRGGPLDRVFYRWIWTISVVNYHLIPDWNWFVYGEHVQRSRRSSLQIMEAGVIHLERLLTFRWN